MGVFALQVLKFLVVIIKSRWRINLIEGRVLQRGIVLTRQRVCVTVSGPLCLISEIYLVITTRRSIQGGCLAALNNPFIVM